jgi:hypothetical protein
MKNVEFECVRLLPTTLCALESDPTRCRFAEWRDRSLSWDRLRSDVAFCFFFIVLFSALRHSKAFCLVASNVGIGDNIDPCPLH